MLCCLHHYPFLYLCLSGLFSLSLFGHSLIAESHQYFTDKLKERSNIYNMHDKAIAPAPKRPRIIDVDVEQELRDKIRR